MTGPDESHESPGYIPHFQGIVVAKVTGETSITIE